MTEFTVQKAGRGNSRIQTPYFTSSDFSLFRQLLGKILWERAKKRKDAQES